MKMKEVKGNDARRIMEIARKFDNVCSDCFVDFPMRMIIWTKPNDTKKIFMRILVSNEKGSLVTANGYYDVEVGDTFSINSKEKYYLGNFFIDDNAWERAEKAFVTFISEITEMRINFNKILLDLGALRYRKVKLGYSEKEEGSFDLHICAYADLVKDDYAFADASQLESNKDEIGMALAYF